VSLFIHHQNAFDLSALGFEFHARNIVTLFGVYVANQPSFGNLTSFFHLKFVVHVLCANLTHGNENFLTQSEGKFCESDKIFRIRYVTPDGITWGTHSVDLLYNTFQSDVFISRIGSISPGLQLADRCAYSVDNSSIVISHAQIDSGYQ
jgi:hypothetical protein